MTGMFITPDCSRLVSVAGDGCVFVWRMPPKLVRARAPQPAAWLRAAVPYWPSLTGWRAGLAASSA